MAAAGGKRFGIDPADSVANARSRFDGFLCELQTFGFGSISEVDFTKAAVNNGQIVPALDVWMNGNAIDQQLAGFG